MYTPRIAVSTNLPQRSSCRDRLVGTAAVPDRHTVLARHTAAPYRHLAAAVATQDRPGGAAAGSARLRQLPPPTPGARCGAPRARFQTNKLTCRAARSRHAVPSCPPTRSASRPAGGLRAGVRPGPEQPEHAREIPPAHGGAEKDGAGVSYFNQDWARLQGRGPRTGGPSDRTMGMAVVVGPWDGQDPPADST